MAVGAGCMAIGFMVPKLVGVTSWLFLLGTVLFSVTQATQVYEGNNLTIRRLKNTQYFADLCFILSGISMVSTTSGWSSCSSPPSWSFTPYTASPTS